jgi:gliding motility-associated-like protein
VLGVLNAIPAGDLMFYKNKLLLAATDGSIYEVNIDNPSASTVFVQGRGIQFYGLIAVPFDCTRNKYYGLEWFGGTTRLHEIDFENKTIIGVACELPFLAYDAASNVDDGNTIGVTIDALDLYPACLANDKANLTVKAYSASSGTLTYTLDNATTNTTGIFPRLSEGQHMVSIKNQQNCSVDTVFTIYHGLSNNFSVSSTNPLSCFVQDGTISISASSGYLPLSYTINNGNSTNDPLFKNLAGGPYAIRISDAKGCAIDTTVLLHYKTIPEFLNSVNVQPTFCGSKSGSIAIGLGAGIDPADVTVSVNNGRPQKSLLFNGLDAGSYSLAIVSKSCRYDTVVQVNRQINESPIITIETVNQLCFQHNGAINLTVVGSKGPYKVNFNGQGINSNLSYKNLSPGMYTMQVIDKDGCTADTATEIISYPFVPAVTSVATTQPTCKDPKAGSLSLSISGTENPYSFSVRNSNYSNYTLIKNLQESQFNAVVFNKDMCAIDTIPIILKTELSPECEYIFVPNAFTPDNNNVNDIFRAMPGYSINYFDFKIFNRWGQLVFSKKTKQAGWDGRWNGKPQAPGVFTWVLTYNTTNNSTKRLKNGTVVLIR